MQKLLMRQHKDTFYLKLLVAVIATMVAVAASCCLGSSGVTMSDVISYIT